MLVESVVIERKVRGHADPRVDLVDEVARGVCQCMVDVDGVVKEEFGQPIFEQIDVRQIGLKLGNKNVDRQADRRRSTRTKGRSSRDDMPRRRPSRASAANGGS